MSPYSIAAIAGLAVAVLLLGGLFRSLYIGSSDGPINWYLGFLVAAFFTWAMTMAWMAPTYGTQTITIVVHQ